MTTSFHTLITLLQYRASDISGTANKTAFTYLNDGETVSGSVTYAELDLQARSIAAHLQKITSPGDRVLLLYPPSLEYIISFFACIYAGVIAVPAVPPTNQRTSPRLQVIAKNSNAAAALGTPATVQRMQELNADNHDALAQLIWFSSDNLTDLSFHWKPTNAQPSDIVFLQYTSGSTGNPKGVMVSHKNLLANMVLSQTVYGLREEDTYVSWLPPHHDFGLIGAIALPVFVGCHCVQFPPAAFLIRPYRWLKLLSDYQARMTGAPNFAYELCVKQISDQQKKQLDLSCVEILVNGAERIRYGTLRRFSEAFLQCGLKPEAMTPAYGLAESVLFVSANMRKSVGEMPKMLHVNKVALTRNTLEISDAATESVELVSTGLAEQLDHSVIIVDPSSCMQCSENSIGEIWIRGPSVAQEYWNLPEESGQVFGGILAGGDDNTKYLRTGDLGSIHQGELYITGRIKEMMVFKGRNIYPQDVEATIERLDPAFRVNGCAVFSLEDNETTQLVIIQEIESRKEAVVDQLAEKILSALVEQHEIMNVATIFLVKTGHIPRTSSGKIQRGRCKELYDTNQFAFTWSWHQTENVNSISLSRQSLSYEAPQGEIEIAIANIWQELLGLERVGRHDHFFELGGHSLLAVQFASRIRTSLGTELALRDLFAYPTLTALAQGIGQSACTTLSAILPANRDGALPLSFAQQRLWFLDQLDHAAGAAYHIPAGLRLQGQLNQAALQAALDRILARHEALRTSFVTQDDGQPVQLFAPADVGFALQEVDLSDFIGNEQEAAVVSYTEEEARAPFDLSTGPLIRGCLLRLSDQEHILLVTQHHIVSDGWSIGILVQEFSALYTAFSQQQPDPLPPLSIQYADYAAWQKEWLQGEVLQQQVNYWQQHLVGAPALLEMPTDHPRPSVQSYQGKRIAVTLPAALTQDLRALSQRHGATLFMTFLAGWSALLSRMSGQNDVVIGTPFANRQRSEIESLIGFFVNTLALRVQMDDDPSVVQLLTQVRANTLEAYAHQDIPFEQVVDAIKPVRSLSHSAVFQAMLVLQNTPMGGELSLPGLILSDIATPHRTTQFDLTLSLSEAGGFITGSLEYASDLFEHATMERLIGHLQVLLSGMAADETKRISQLPLLTPEQYKQLIVDFNDTAVDYPHDQLTHQLFEAQVANSPDAIAVVFEEQFLTYDALNKRANQVAHALIGLGIRPDDRVAICVERSLEMVVGLLGILKAGGAYVPLDPSYPQERLVHMLTDSAPRALLTQSPLEETVAQWAQAALSLPTLLLDQPLASPEHNPDAKALGITPNHLAYVIYTSGSTGTPKGVMVEHHALNNYLFWASTYYASQTKKSSIISSPIAFDATITSLYVPLISGGTTTLIREGQELVSLESLLQQSSWSLLKITPPHLKILGQRFQEDGVQCFIELMVVGGEALPTATVKLWQELVPSARLVNEYGPTETVVGCIVFEPTDNLPNSNDLPIGR
ncbi:AMP-binding protein, partial [Massilia pseudoviolaceinigra]|uniref:AMP-binding protein n=1 Tax=Massilia pseudoviolaceinigra TaxID=3057165 RepID=UPI002796CF91